MVSEALEKTSHGLIVRIHVQPKASKSEFVGLHGDRLKVRVQAKPVEGAANEAVIKLLAKTAGVPKSAVSLIRGATSRQKDFEIRRDAPDEALEKIRRASGLMHKTP